METSSAGISLFDPTPTTTTITNPVVTRTDLSKYYNKFQNQILKLIINSKAQLILNKERQHIVN
mgnify:CR=1 FL=1